MKQCLKCGLLSPDGATECDCGFDLAAVSVRLGHEFPSRLPVPIKVHFVLCLLSVALVVYLFATMRPRQYNWQPTESESLGQILGFALSVAVNVVLYSALLAHRNWARVTLGILTLPSGLLLFLPSAKAFTRPLDEPSPDTHVSLDLRS
jgi:hypothetical protein